MQTIKKLFSFRLLFLFLLDGIYGYIIFMEIFNTKEPFSLATLLFFLFQLFFLYIFLSITVETIKENISSSNLNEAKIFIKNYIFPPSVEASLRDTYPQLTKSQIEEVVNYLRLFFIENLLNVYYLNNNEGFFRKLLVEIDKSLKKKEQEIQENHPNFSFGETNFEEIKEVFFSNTPSLVLNRAWNVFSLSDEYESFSYRLFDTNFLYRPILEEKSNNRTLELPNEEINFINIWESQCRVEGIDPFFPKRVPLMFTLDEMLNIADGIKFEIDEEALREVLSIEDAPSPNQLIDEVDDGESELYLAKKLQYYLGNEAYCGLYQKEDLKDLLKKIQNSDPLNKMVFGTYSDVKFFMENVLKNSAPPPQDIGSSSGASV